MTIISNTTRFVKSRLTGTEGGHDWYHTERVWKMAVYIQKNENAGDLLTIELAALLHDIADPKFHNGDENKGSQLAYNFLIHQGIDEKRIEHIQHIIKHISFKGGIVRDNIDTIEYRIVQDADRLDALGAIGIARAFNYGGYRNRPIHDPDIPLKEYRDSKEYYRSDAPTINHFYEKLLKLKGLMNTDTGRKLAEKRHRYMKRFLDRFFSEWYFE